MKNMYIGYYTKTPQEIKEMWDNGLITFDPNVLLNLYRYSPETRAGLTRLIDKLSDKIFLTHLAGLEFHRRRFEVIDEQKAIYEESYNKILKAKEDINSKNRHPILKERTRCKLLDALDEVRVELEANIDYYYNLLVEDGIVNEINLLFENRVERGFAKEEEEKIIEEGKRRYEKNNPAGFDDKHKEITSWQQDFLLWKQIVLKAKKARKNIILISDEKKNAWSWKLKDDKTIIGPRQELIEEIYNEARAGFLLYSTKEFMEYGLPYIQESVSMKIIEEVKERA